MTRYLAGLVMVLSACATQVAPPRPQISPNDESAAREALARLFPKDANLYTLASLGQTETAGVKLARFERALPPAGEPVTRTRVAFCLSGEQGWKCDGPWPGARVSVNGARYSALAPEDVDDATLVALFGYVGSDCFATQARTVGLASDAALIRSVALADSRYEMQMTSPKGLHLVSVERATGSCRFELRSVSALAPF